MTEIRWALPQDRREIQDYLFENMGKISHERWYNILDCRWNQTDEKYGVLVEEKGNLVGFLGIVFADREFSGKAHRTGNITSWFLEKHLRRGGLGQEMLDLITEPTGVTYTAISANFRSGALLKKIGWQQLEDEKLLWKRSNATPPPEISLVSGAAALAEMLPPEATKIVADHHGLNLTPHLLSTKTEGDLFFVTYTKFKGDDNTAHYEILQASNPAMLSKHVKHLANLLLPEGKTLLSSDKRFFLPGVKANSSQPLQVPRYFKPQENLPGAQVDLLYGEVVLLDLKIY